MKTLRKAEAPKPMSSTVRLHIWLENGESVVFGSGRVMLLDMVERHGSLRKAANAIGMSYQAAWSKLRATERTLGVRLVEPVGAKRDGSRLTEHGRLLRDRFRRWFEQVENCALLQAETLFPWPIEHFHEHEAPKQL